MNVYLAVIDTLADWEIGYLTAELHSRRFFRDPGMACNLVKLGVTLDAVHSMGGIRYVPDVTVDTVQLQADDLLLLPGGAVWDTPVVRPFLTLARDALDQGHNVAAICGATVGLASTGALDRRRHTSNDLGSLQAACPAYTGQSHYRHKPAVRGDNLITASGLASLEFSYEVLKMLKVWRPATATAWYRLHKTRQACWYDELVASMSPEAQEPLPG
jgi:putative intracellular protease/amidase